MLGLAVSVLERHGYKVLAARGPTEADAIIAEHGGPIHLLLTDVIMPGGTGPELAARAIESRPELRVLLMSGYAQDAFMDRAPADLGATSDREAVQPEPSAGQGADRHRHAAEPQGLARSAPAAAY